MASNTPTSSTSLRKTSKGANILVDNKGCIKLADFGASKKVVELATINGAKSMKGTAYWMAPEVILQTGHSFSADIWSVACTMIEMAIGKAPWSQQYQEVAALFHIGTTKSHPPIPEHLSAGAKDFLLKCLQKEPELRPSASDLLQHPFVTGEYWEPHPLFCNSTTELGNLIATPGVNPRNSMSPVIRRSSCIGLKDVCEVGSVRCSTVYPENLSQTGTCWRADNCDDMCQIDDKDDFCSASVRFPSVLASSDLNKSFNPVSEPMDDWPCKFDESPEVKRSESNLYCRSLQGTAESSGVTCKDEHDFTFPSGPSAAEDDDEVTESKIRAFLDEKALDLKKLQTPLYEEFYNTVNAAGPPSVVGIIDGEKLSNLCPKGRSPKRLPSRRLSAVIDAVDSACHLSNVKHASNANGLHDRALQEIQPPQHGEWKELLGEQQATIHPSVSFSERQKKWKEELDEELESKREMLRQAGIAGKPSSPKNRILTRQRERLRFPFTGK